MVWYLIVIPIVIAIIIKLVIPYIKKNHIDNTVTCGICSGKYNKKLRGCPHCGVGPTGVSVDILASHNTKDIVLVNVTLGLPDVSDLDREKNFRIEFKKKVSNKKMDVRSMLFTAYPVNQLQTPAQENEVRLIGKTELESILDNLEKGETELARKMIWQHDEVRF